MVVPACTLSSGQSGEQRIPGGCWTVSPAELVSFNERPHLKTSDGTVEEMSQQLGVLVALQED